LVTDRKDNNTGTTNIMALDTLYDISNKTALGSAGGGHTIDFAYFMYLHQYQKRQLRKIKSYIRMHIKFISIQTLL
jgi:hypothetical protein